MAKFIVTVRETTVIRYLVEAESAEEASFLPGDIEALPDRPEDLEDQQVIGVTPREG